MATQNKDKESENLFRIKEILFGEELSDLDKKLEQIKADFAAAIEEANKQLRQNLADLNEQLKALDQQTKDNTQALKTSIDQQFELMGRQSLSKKEMAEMLEYFTRKLKDDPAQSNES